MSDLTKWLAVMTKPKMETEAEAHLTRQNFEVYLPLWVDVKMRQRRWQKITGPMFPRYLFVRRTHAEQSIAPIRSTRGVTQLVRFGIEPAWADDALIQDIRTLENVRTEDGETLTPFKKGDKVNILEGPFKGISAEVLAHDEKRVIVLLKVLGQMQKLPFEVNSLCPAAS